VRCCQARGLGGYAMDRDGWRDGWKVIGSQDGCELVNVSSGTGSPV